ncbi:TPA: hypothetical protein ACTR19_004548 [Yersinia enterocolitica]|uniref:hypothetical protein n=1 Tax=Yersinia enterocolitica TaxID=630 RepID=UPI001C6085A2|nr:hypothetical protein [Yersinia enterocolitica]EKN3563140.1 hypothetical protein [Yersinia enterocolitica]MBW5877477.1 hypothetical protein [Yersinia enterocolitica]HDL6704994.1 hypothetical protein [Yersinia enterocolitica]HDL7891999.1 hypothetical protein [Yersinia enterocolitica]HDM8317281.1 hypothetical protein [Yersinia enterocolitica]
MARSRNIKPGFFTNDELAECSPYARLLFAGLWTIADKEGRLDDRPKKIKALVLPFDNVDCDELLQQLHQHSFITRYSVDGGAYVQINNWKKHQNPHCKESASEIPEQVIQPIETKEAPDKYGTSTVQEPDQNNLNPADSLNLIPDSPILIPFNTQAADATCQVDDELPPVKQDDLPPEPQEADVHQMASRYAFEGSVIRLSQKDFDCWKSLFPNIDLVVELTRLDLEFSHEKPKSWFTTASAKLNYQNKQPTYSQPRKTPVAEKFSTKNYGTTDAPAWMEE